jgi:hypothetical protein
MFGGPPPRFGKEEPFLKKDQNARFSSSKKIWAAHAQLFFHFSARLRRTKCTKNVWNAAGGFIKNFA